MTNELLLKNGRLVDPKNNIDKKLDIFIQDGKIAGLEEEFGDIAKNVINLEGKIIVPGIIDMHTHLSKKFGNIGYKMVAETGVTTAIDFAGPVEDVVEDLSNLGSGLNVGLIDAIIPGSQFFKNNRPTPTELNSFIDYTLEKGSLGIKLFGGHAPLDPVSTEDAIRLANQREIMIAFHAGTTESKSDMTGMREAIKLAKDNSIILAHINAYCRGRVNNPYEEIKEAFDLLNNHPNIFGESHLAVMNGTSGKCTNGVPDDYVTKVCLDLYGFEISQEGLEKAIKAGVVSVIKIEKGANLLIKGNRAYDHWVNCSTNVSISFPANIPTVAVACATEKNKINNEFLLKVTSTDGGGIPRNNLIKRMLSLYHLGYLSLSEVVQKTSYNPALLFGLYNKGHLSIGADADITVIDLEKSCSTMSIVKGEINMIDGVVIRKNGTYLITESGIQTAKRMKVPYEVIDPGQSLLYSSNNLRS